MEDKKQEQESDSKTPSSPSSVLPQNRASETEATMNIATPLKHETRSLCISSATKMCEEIIRELGPVESKKLFQLMSESELSKPIPPPSVSKEEKTEETAATNSPGYSIRQELVRLFGQNKSTTECDEDEDEDEISGKFQIYGRKYDGSLDSVLQSIMSYYEFNRCFPIGNRLKGFMKHWVKIDVCNDEVVNEIKVLVKESMRSILLYYFSFEGCREIHPIFSIGFDQHMDGYFSN